uniref:Uncharacterized protein n=1 Tax=Candidatus Kentrum sp. LPFa TaxID=2126335 RepID=A0A450XKJ3_9GAMM|nr:MAG: hypothetical protein BECKLPF1236A_GA0070988_100952 [Candidatus Kentron sp. LPFa]VFK29749.1 MAG: hypothetical protein BECKLPF1236C_GA0070990_100942 [Candidatus Kentron sp. LPFa]
MIIDDAPVYPGSPCPHSTGDGCDDYDNRPNDPCVHFNCGWIMPNSPLPDWMKPNNAKVIVLFDKLNWNNLPVDLAVPLGKRIPPRSLDWLMRRSQQDMRPLIYTEQIVVSGRFQKEQPGVRLRPTGVRTGPAALATGRQKAVVNN